MSTVPLFRNELSYTVPNRLDRGMRRPDATELEFAMLAFIAVPLFAWGIMRMLFAGVTP